MALSPKAIAAFTEEFCVRTGDDIVVGRWHRDRTRVIVNLNGVSGWATVVRSWKGTVTDDAVIRIAAHAVLW